MDDTTNAAWCSSDCITATMNINNPNPTGLRSAYIIGGFLHAHTTAVAMKASVVHSNGSETIIDENQNFDFDYQTSNLLDSSKFVELFETDNIMIECTYNTKQRSAVVWGGDSTNEEMCLAVLMVYPKSILPSFIIK